MEKEYFLVVYEESGDEIHFMLFEMEHLHKFKEFLSKERTDKSIDELLKFVDEDNSNGTYFCIQTYCNEEWPFNGLNIKRIISIPQFGM